MIGIARSVANEFPAESGAQVGQGLPLQRALRYFALFAGQPGFTDLLGEAVIGINGSQAQGSPRTRVKCRLHPKWEEIAHPAAGGQIAGTWDRNSATLLR